MVLSRAALRPYWLIAKYENDTLEILTIDLDGAGEALPVFSFEEEAELFLRCEAPGKGWTVRETRIGELVSVLSGPCSGASMVALDPLPEIVSGGMVGLVSLDRTSFLRTLVAEGGSTGARVGESPTAGLRGGLSSRPTTLLASLGSAAPGTLG